MFNRQERGGVQCCRFCGPPRRQVGCHVTCEDYIKAKQEYEEQRDAQREEMGRIYVQDSICRRRKHRYLDAVHWKIKRG